MSILEQNSLTSDQAITFFPASWVDQSLIIDQFDPRILQNNLSCILVGRVTGVRFGFQRRIPRLSGYLVDPQQRSIAFSFIGGSRELQAEVEDAQCQNKTFAVAGRIALSNGNLFLNQCSLPIAEWWGQVMPVYRPHDKSWTASKLRAEIQQQLSAENLKRCADRYRQAIKSLPQKSQVKVSEVAGMPDGWQIENLLFHVHRPRTIDEAVWCLDVLKRYAAIVTLAQLRKAYLRPAQHREREPLTSKQEKPRHLKRLMKIPFALTAEQGAVVKALIEDVKKPVATHAALCGDVGTGKTVVYAMVIAHVIDHGGRVAVLMPSRPLANQIYDEITGFWPDINAALVTQENECEDLINRSLLIGTTALLNRITGGFDLVVVDEQHKLGAEQRQRLVSATTHQLDVSATLIPRTLALTQFGAVKVHRIRGAHSNKVIHKKMLEPQQFNHAMTTLTWIVQHGYKAVVICPKREVTGREQLIEDRYSTTNIASWLSSIFPGKVRMAHGGQDGSENDDAIHDMKLGEGSVLVSTTVVETGITIPKLHYALIIHPERLGLIALHQLAGRLARNGGKGYMHLWSPEPLSKKSVKRINTFLSTSDGYELALQDMELRGVGDLRPEGVAQSGGNPDIMGNHPVSFRLIENVRTQLDLDDLSQ